MAAINKKTLAIIALIGSSIIWGIATPILKLTILSIPPFTLALLRFVIALIIVIPIFFTRGYWKLINIRDLPLIAWAGILGITLNIGLLFLGASLTTGVHISILLATIPAFTVLAAVTILKEKVNLNTIIGIAISFLGTLVIIGQPLLERRSQTHNAILGDLLILGSVIAWALYTIINKEIAAKYKPLAILPLIFLIGTLSFLPFAFWEFYQNSLWIFSISKVAVFGIFYYGLFCSITAYFLFTWGLTYASATFAGIETYLIPLISLPTSAILLNEKIDRFFIAGAVLILIGLIICEYRKRPTPK
jgi:drug/metabolite transporter (DMT)-like permease